MLTDRDLRQHLFDPDVMRRIGVTPVDALLESVSVREIAERAGGGPWIPRTRW